MRALYLMRAHALHTKVHVQSKGALGKEEVKRCFCVHLVSYEQSALYAPCNVGAKKYCVKHERAKLALCKAK